MAWELETVKVYEIPRTVRELADRYVKFLVQGYGEELVSVIKDYQDLDRDLESILEEKVIVEALCSPEAAWCYLVGTKNPDAYYKRWGEQADTVNRAWESLVTDIKESPLWDKALKFREMAVEDAEAVKLTLSRVSYKDGTFTNLETGETHTPAWPDAKKVMGESSDAATALAAAIDYYDILWRMTDDGSFPTEYGKGLEDDNEGWLTEEVFNQLVDTFKFVQKLGLSHKDEHCLLRARHDAYGGVYAEPYQA